MDGCLGVNGRVSDAFYASVQFRTGQKPTGIYNIKRGFTRQAKLRAPRFLVLTKKNLLTPSLNLTLKAGRRRKIITPRKIMKKRYA